MTTRIGVGHPVVQHGAVALVSLATALTLGRVFEDGRFLGPVVLAAIVPHGVGLLGRLRSWDPIRTAFLALAVTTLVLVWATAGFTTAYGVPTGATLRRVDHLLGGGWRIFRIGIAPVPATAGVVLLGALAVAVVATCGDYLAERPDVTLGVLGPTLVLFVLVTTLASSRLEVVATAVYVAASLTALAVLDAARSERRRTWFTGHRLASDAMVIRSAVTIGGIALLIAVVVTPLVPGVDDPPLLDYRNRSGGVGSGFGDYESLSPLVSLRARLRERSDTELFRVRAPRALYWRLVALDRFDGQTWSLSSEARDADAVLRSPEDAAGRRIVRQRFEIGSLADRWLPAAYEPFETNVGNARVVPESLTLVAPSPIAGFQYEVRSRVPVAPDPTQIAATAQPVPARLTAALSLPSSFGADHRRQARAIVAGRATPWDRAVALESYFARGDFTYDLTPELGDGTDAINAFLQTRRGFCQQFAATYAAFARAVGLPARVVVGFTPGERDAASDDYIVHGRDAHAWVEVWFAGIGWRTFEPTPAGPLPGQAVTTGTRVGDTGGATDTSPTTRAATDRSTPTTGGTGGAPIGRNDARVSTAGGDHGSLDASSVIPLVVVALALLVGLALGVARLSAPRRMRHRRRAGVVPASQVTGAWHEALRAVAAAGLPVSPALTPAEQARTVVGHGLPAAAIEPLTDLATLHAQATFSREGVDAELARRAWSALDDVRTALTAGTPAAERLRRALRAARDHDLETTAGPRA